MERLVVMDYSTATVHVYSVEEDKQVTDETISNSGLRANDCYWMAGNIDFEVHNEKLIK